MSGATERVDQNAVTLYAINRRCRLPFLRAGVSMVEPKLNLVMKVAIPNTLNNGAQGVERLYSLIAETPPASHYVFDMQEVAFIEPCGVMALLSAARQCTDVSGRRVILINIDEQVYLYLDRMNLFTLAGQWLTPLKSATGRWSRNPHTAKLLELTTVCGSDDVEEVLERASRIFAPCLTEDELGSLLSVLSELCSNIFEHSRDPYGCVLIQKYYQEQRQRESVRLSVGDLGRGVRANLVEAHGAFGGEGPLEYIRAAMNGRSSRLGGRGGLGLLNVRSILAEHGGYVCMRSETAAVTDFGGADVHCRSGLAHVPGTQVSVAMHSVLNS